MFEVVDKLRSECKFESARLIMDEDFLFGDLLGNLLVLKIFGRLFQQSEYIEPVFPAEQCPKRSFNVTGSVLPSKGRKSLSFFDNRFTDDFLHGAVRWENYPEFFKVREQIPEDVYWLR